MKMNTVLVTIFMVPATLLIPQILAILSKIRFNAASEEYDCDYLRLERGGLTRHNRAICGFRAD